MRIKRPFVIPEEPVKAVADPIFLHVAIVSLVLAIIGATCAILSDGWKQHSNKKSLNFTDLTYSLMCKENFQSLRQHILMFTGSFTQRSFSRKW